ncbi:MAG TPA: HNH endonuclease signature motif containing protein [bacterium]|nr:HNH endonuclease signature motif containing protein [bacterium]
MGANNSTKVLLAFRSGDRCAFPTCGRTLSVDGKQANSVVTGEAAHIAGENKGSARYDSSMTDEQRNHYNNLIYLCGDHHTQIDKQEKDFPVERLLRMKTEHESKVREAVTEAFATIGFPELEEATQWIMHVQPSEASKDFSLIALEDKIKKNTLGNGSRTIVTMGLSVTREVRAYVESVAQTDSDFPERLKVGFLTEYYRLKKEGHTGDNLFDMMCCFAQRGFAEQAKRSAGLAVLIYLFEACEVFEK